MFSISGVKYATIWHDLLQRCFYWLLLEHQSECCVFRTGGGRSPNDGGAGVSHHGAARRTGTERSNKICVFWIEKNLRLNSSRHFYM